MRASDAGARSRPIGSGAVASGHMGRDGPKASPFIPCADASCADRRVRAFVYRPPVPAMDPSPMISIGTTPSDAMIGAVELAPILDDDGVVVDHLVTWSTGMAATLMFGDLGAARGRRVGELDQRRSDFFRQLLDRLQGHATMGLDLRMLERLMRVLLTALPDGGVSIVFARIDAPVASAGDSDNDATRQAERIRTMLGVLTDGVAMYEPIRDPAGSIVDFVCLEMSDADPVLPADEQIGRRLLELYPEAADNGTFAGYRGAMDSGEPWVPEPVRYQRSDQHYVYRLRAVAAGDQLVISWRDTLVEGDPLDAVPSGEPLTPRQVEILQAISDGRSTADIAADAFLSPFTVRNEVRRILAKLGVRTRAEAVAVGISQRLITTRTSDRDPG